MEQQELFDEIVEFNSTLDEICLGISTDVYDDEGIKTPIMVLRLASGEEDIIITLPQLEEITEFLTGLIKPQTKSDSL